MRVSEIRVKQIRVNQGLVVLETIRPMLLYSNHDATSSLHFALMSRLEIHGSADIWHWENVIPKIIVFSKMVTIYKTINLSDLFVFRCIFV